MHEVHTAFQTLSTLFIKINYFWGGYIKTLTPYKILSDIWNSLSGIQCVWVHISQLVLLKCIEILYSMLSFEKCSVPYNNILSINWVCLIAESFLDEHISQYVLEYILHPISYIILQYFALYLTVIPCWTYN